MEGNIFDIQRFSIHDGPGIRTTIFFKGCPLKCFWCHNPESQNPNPEIGFYANKCLKCGICETICPLGACHLLNPKRIDREKCNLCGLCVEQCPSSALKMIGRETTIEEILKEVAQDEVFYQQSGGGVTLSGGEPLYQYDFALALAKRLKILSYHLTLDTSGYYQGNDSDLTILLNFAQGVDLILYDIKMIDDQKHQKYTGISNLTILENASILSLKYPKKMIFRYPLIPGLNDSPEDINLLKGFLSSLSNTVLEILPYHRIGISKYCLIGKEYELEMINLPEEEKLSSLAKNITQLPNITLIGSFDSKAVRS